MNVANIFATSFTVIHFLFRSLVNFMSIFLADMLDIALLTKTAVSSSFEK